MPRTAFRSAAEAGDLDALLATLAPDVVFRSPVVFAPYTGREATGLVLGVVMEVFEDFRYVDQLSAADSEALVFQARIGDRRLDGIDHLRFGADGLVSQLTVFIRPLSGVLAARDAIGARLPSS
jgi:hypothetical protein